MSKKSFVSIAKFTALYGMFIGIVGMFLSPSSKQIVFAGPCSSPSPSGSPSIPASTTADLGKLSSAIIAYRGATEGLYPTDLNQLVPKYISSIPACVTEQGRKTGVTYYSNSVTSGNKIDASKISGSGKWGYVKNLSLIDAGTIFIDSKVSASANPASTDPKYNKSWLGSMRSALSIYYGDTEGVNPTTLTALVPKYIGLNALPFVITCSKGYVNTVTIYQSRPTTVLQVKDSGGWGYVPSTGEIFIDSREDNLFKL